MKPTFPASDLWDWPVSRLGRWAMGLLGAAMIMLVLSPPLMWLIDRHDHEVFISMWYALPLLTTMSLAFFSGLLAIVAIAVKRERSVYLWFPIVAALVPFVIFT